MNNTNNNIKRNAIVFLIFIGLIALLSDFTHEAARSIYGPYLGLLGVSAFLISLVSGLGEFIGHGFRILTGIIADKTKKYWLMMFIGYAINLLVIPFLYFVEPNIWQLALVLILLERFGKAIRAPAKSALTSFTSSQLGAGKAFALQEMFDQIGAFLGPLFVVLILSLNSGTELEGYQLAFAGLGIFAIATLVMVTVAKKKYPNPIEFETKTLVPGFKGNQAFVLYMIAVAFLAFGFIDYPLIAYHLNIVDTLEVIDVPLLYSMAMGIDAISALIFGNLFDKIGVKSLMIAVIIAMLFAPFIFLLDGVWGMIIGVSLWGIGMGAQESILKAAVATVVEKEKRATAYGIFYSVFGTCWFLGSLLIGYLYEISLVAMVCVSVGAELLSIIFLILFMRKTKKNNLAEKGAV